MNIIRNRIWPTVIPILLIFFLVLVNTAQAFSLEYVQQYNYSAYYDRAGFFSGIWHGLIAPYSLLVRLLTDIEMYAYINTGWFYDLGFLLGIAGSLPIGWIAAIVAVITTFI